MPRTKLDEKFNRPKHRADRIKGLILEAAQTQDKRNTELAAMAHMSRSTYQEKIGAPMREWKLGQILDICQGLNIAIEDVREAIRY